MDKANVAQNLRRMAVAFQSIVEAADAIEKIGSVEQATAEAERARDAAVKERDAAKVELAIAKADLKKVEQVAADVAVEAEDRVDEVRKQADTDAEAIVEKAKQDAHKIVATAAAEAQRSETASREELALAYDHLAESKRERDAVLAQRDAAAAELADLEKRIAAARAAVSKMLGG